MPSVHRTTATLRFYGDDLDPDNVTKLLGAQPSRGVKKGDKWLTRHGSEQVAQHGAWLLKAGSRSPGDLDGQIVELLALLTDDIAVWQGLTARFRADIFCGLFMEDGNEGISLRPETILAAGSRGLLIGFDVYAGDVACATTADARAAGDLPERLSDQR